MVSTQTLTWSSKDKSFYGEISDLSESLFHLGKVDIGFYLTSERTGEVILMIQSDVRRDPEGDVTEFVFTPVSDSIRRFPAVKNLKVRLLND